MFPDGKRLYMCPLDGCAEGLVSPRTCDAHINRHLGHEYVPCIKCGHTNPSRDSYDKHKCFAGVKTGGKRSPSRGRLQQRECRKRSFQRKQKPNRFNRLLLSRSWKFFQNQCVPIHCLYSRFIVLLVVAAFTELQVFDNSMFTKKAVFTDNIRLFHELLPVHE